MTLYRLCDIVSTASLATLAAIAPEAVARAARQMPVEPPAYRWWDVAPDEECERVMRVRPVGPERRTV
jgi:hypothetical protein